MFAAMASYIRDVLDAFGVDLLRAKVGANCHPATPCLRIDTRKKKFNIFNPFDRLFLAASLLQQGAAATSHLASLEGVVEQLSRFRSQVRAFALARTHVDGSSAKPGLHPDRVQLLKSCDTLRDNLAAHGVLIKVHRRPRDDCCPLVAPT